MTEIIIQKQCSSCKLTRPVKDFYTNNTKKNGYQSICKVCKRKPVIDTETFTNQPIKFSINTKFLKRIFSKIKVSTENFYKGVPCWEWQGAKFKEGYAQLVHTRKTGKKTITVHRLMYESFVEPIDKNLVCDHLCRVRHCVNPAHIEPVTDKVNILRGQGLCAQYAKNTHCKHGHELSGDNLRLYEYRDRISRICKQCVNDVGKRFHIRLKELPFDHPQRIKYRNGMPSRQNRKAKS